MKKKILLTSLLSIVMCLSLVIGATMALFASRSEEDIAITSGRVDVAAKIVGLTTYSKDVQISEEEVAEGAFENGGKASFDGDTVSLDRVSPGDRVVLRIDIANSSSIPSMQRVTLACRKGEALFGQLLVGIGDNGTDFTYYGSYASAWEDVAASGEGAASTSTVYVSVELPAYATENWQDMECDISLAVEAVQGNASVSEGKSSLVYRVTTQEELEAALAQMQSGETVILDGGAWDGAEIAFSDAKTVYVRGYEVGTLTVNAPNGVVYYYNDIGTAIGDGRQVISDGFAYSASEEVYYIFNAGGMTYFSDRVNGGESYVGETVKLAQDIDLSGVAWTPIGTNVDEHCFDGTFDGSGYMISNMSVSAMNTVYGGETSGWDGYKNTYSYAGLFGVVTGTVKNVNFTDCTVNVTDENLVSENGEAWRGDVYAGIAVGMNFGTVENVTVSNSSVNARAWLICSAGGVVGENTAADMTALGYPLYVGTISGCTVDNVNVSAVSDGWTPFAGGIVGSSGDRLYYNYWITAQVSDCKAVNSAVSSKVLGAASADQIDWPSPDTYFGRAYCGGIGGCASSTASSGNTVEGNTLLAESYASGSIFKGDAWGYGA